MLARTAVLSALALGLALIVFALQGVSAVGSTLAAGEAAAKVQRIGEGKGSDCPKPRIDAPAPATAGSRS